VRLASLPVRPGPFTGNATELADRFPGELIIVACGAWLEFAGPGADWATYARDTANTGTHTQVVAGSQRPSSIQSCGGHPVQVADLLGVAAHLGGGGGRIGAPPPARCKDTTTPNVTFRQGATEIASPSRR
jgi:hypothetical protein